ncbi:MAG: alanine racemase [Bacteroidales bacterium]|nr:alanine racemase [Bacteroidales bacterium]
MFKKDYKTWVEVSKSAMLSNIEVFRKTVGKKVKIAAVVKANAYGHGLKETVTLIQKKVDLFAVDGLDEALIVREINKEIPVLVMGYIPQTRLNDVIENDISFVAYNMETLRKIVSLKKNIPAKIHIKAETGLNRQGVQLKNIKKLLDYIKSHKKEITIEGIYTHFANIEDTIDSSYAMKHLDEFKKFIATINKFGFEVRFVHASASAGALLYPETHFGMVRIGFGIYGWWMSTETRVMLMAKKRDIVLEPVMTWKSIVAQIKDINKGESVGYGQTWFASRKTKIAIIPVGYSDGFDRKLSNVGRVIIRGKYAPVIGRIAMNMFVVDITDIGNVKLEDEVCLLGNMSGLKISADEIAKKIGTINYEVVARINPLIPRIIV